MRVVRGLLAVLAVAAATLAWAEFEHEVKAAFLFQFLSYVEWPEASFKDGHSPLVIGVLGADEVLEDLKEIVRGRTAQGRPVEVRALTPNDTASVHVMFVGRSGAALLPSLARGEPVLLVSEIDGALRKGAMVNLVRDGEHVRFEVAQDAAERTGLRISSRMLAVAQHVESGRP